MRILVTNDDGWEAEGLRALRAAVEGLGETLVVAPEFEQSGASHALTLNRPLRIRRRGDHVFSVDGTPADCVLLALRGLGEHPGFRPDLVVSGMNHGANLGDDVLYSGTVAAAMEAHLLGIPGIAFSVASFQPAHWAEATLAAREFLDRILRESLPFGLLLNVNLPDRPQAELKGVRVTKLARRTYEGPIEERRDPHGRPYYWIGGTDPVWHVEEETDRAAVQAGWVAVTPLHLDLTDYARMDVLAARLHEAPREA